MQTDVKSDSHIICEKIKVEAQTLINLNNVNLQLIAEQTLPEGFSIFLPNKVDIFIRILFDYSHFKILRL